MFLVVDGPDGVGKSSVVRELKNALEEKGYRVVLSREPGGTGLAENIRGILLSPNMSVDCVTQALLFNAARRDHVLNLILPQSGQENTIVLVDRFLLSTIAHQAPYIGTDRILSMHRDFIGVLPDLMFVLDAHTEVIMERMKGRQASVDIFEPTTHEDIENRRMAYLGGLQDMLEEFSQDNPLLSRRWHVVSNNQSMDVVIARMLKKVADYIEWKGIN